MPVYTPPFSVQEYNTFHKRSEAAAAVKNADPHIHERLQEIIKKHQLAHRFGIGLVYKHFDLQPGQALIYNQFVTAEYIDPKIIRDIELYGEANYGTNAHVRPIAWAMTSSNKLMPYQFICYEKDGTHPVDPRLPGWQDFMHEFMHEVEWAELRPYVGLKIIQVTDRHDLVSRHDQISDPPEFFPSRLPRSRTPSPGPRGESRTRRREHYYKSIPEWRDLIQDPEGSGTAQERYETVKKSRSQSPERTPEEIEAAKRCESRERRREAYLQALEDSCKPLGTPTEEAARERRGLFDDGK